MNPKHTLSKPLTPKLRQMICFSFVPGSLGPCFYSHRIALTGSSPSALGADSQQANTPTSASNPATAGKIIHSCCIAPSGNPAIAFAGTVAEPYSTAQNAQKFF
jgi:hypothetical protein